MSTVICMELQLGLSLPSSTTQGFDLNSQANEAAASVNHDLHDDSSLTSSCTSDFNDDTKCRKRGFGRSFEDHSEDDYDHHGLDCHQSLLPFLPLTPHQSKEDDKYHSDYEDDRDYPSNIIQPPNSMFVKVKMEGVAIARKVDLNLYQSVEKLKETLMDMFGKWNENRDCYKLTYQDMEGDWLLAEDAPWRVFIQSVQRIELVKNMDGMI